MKRCIDVIISGFALFVFSLPMLLIVFIIKIHSPGPAIYWSKRVGQYGHIFNMPKFRTMHVHTPELPTYQMDNAEQHITDFGFFLRKTSLDELPQFLSVITGDMSIVGPRPMIKQHIELNAKRKKKGIDKLRPGITGWAQINGRDDLTNDEKLQLDMEYLKRQSICFDIFVMIKTLAYVCKANGVRH